MTRKFIGLSATWLLAAFWTGGGAVAQQQKEQTPAMRRMQQQIAEMRLFVPIYAYYYNVVKPRGAQGVRVVAASDFAFRAEREQKEPFTGERAFSELQKYGSAVWSPGSGFTVEVLQLEVRDDKAVAHVQESIVFKDTVPSAFPKGTTVKSTLSWCWKHTWRRTKGVWKLALWETFEKPIPKAPNQAATMTFTITPK